MPCYVGLGCDDEDSIPLRTYNGAEVRQSRVPPQLHCERLVPEGESANKQTMRGFEPTLVPPAKSSLAPAPPVTAGAREEE